MYQNLFDFLDQSHNLILLDSEMDDLLNHILGAVVLANDRYTAHESPAGSGFVICDNTEMEVVGFPFASMADAQREALKHNYEYGAEFETMNKPRK
jgi:hypothetical protein